MPRSGRSFCFPHGDLKDLRDVFKNLTRNPKIIVIAAGAKDPYFFIKLLCLHKVSFFLILIMYKLAQRALSVAKTLPNCKESDKKTTKILKCVNKIGQSSCL